MRTCTTMPRAVPAPPSALQLVCNELWGSNHPVDAPIELAATQVFNFAFWASF